MRALGRRLRSGRLQHFLLGRLTTAAVAALVLVVPAGILIQRSGGTEARIELGRVLQVERTGTQTCIWLSGSDDEVLYPAFPSGWRFTPDWALRNEVGIFVGDLSGDVVVSAASLAEHRTRIGCRGPGEVVRVLAIVVPERGPGVSPPSFAPPAQLPR